jgi:hypothetical protein
MSMEFNSTWTMPAWTLLPVVLLSSPLVMISSSTTRQVVAFAVLLPLLMMLVAPAIAISIHRSGGVTPAAGHARLLAEQVAQEWRLTTNRPLLLVGGDLDLAYATAFYLSDRPSAFPVSEPENAPSVDRARIARQGIALICYMDREEPVCLHEAVKFAINDLIAHGPSGRRVQVEISRSHFGIAGLPEQYIIFTVPPGTEQDMPTAPRQTSPK